MLLSDFLKVTNVRMLVSMSSLTLRKTGANIVTCLLDSCKRFSEEKQKYGLFLCSAVILGQMTIWLFQYDMSIFRISQTRVENSSYIFSRYSGVTSFQSSMNRIGSSENCSKVTERLQMGMEPR
ncbi:hypothetical protein MT325_m008R [Paramecium bursaria chlorella virus MT325]|uniref:Uncharacterized protein m008R n=1 Tax=Paramecium bursaria Chlorella virus MT325 TaxID=346932 RepID=A7IT88_PBCVM|nr:hypothetical protein MT325_m008R [Paramecium bursaria chlorella virus MT325]